MPTATARRLSDHAAQRACAAPRLPWMHSGATSRHVRHVRHASSPIPRQRRHRLGRRKPGQPRPRRAAAPDDRTQRGRAVDRLHLALRQTRQRKGARRARIGRKRARRHRTRHPRHRIRPHQSERRSRRHPERRRHRAARFVHHERPGPSRRERRRRLRLPASDLHRPRRDGEDNPRDARGRGRGEVRGRARLRARPQGHRRPAKPPRPPVPRTVRPRTTTPSPW